MNWGNKLLITFLVFGAGISFLVYRSMHTNFELVEKDYYKSELRYQEIIDGTNHANALGSAVQFEQDNNGLLLQLPVEMKDQMVSGTVLFYCDYDASNDRKFSLHVNAGGLQSFDRGKIVPGKYMVKINWNANGTNYYTEKMITVD